MSKQIEYFKKWVQDVNERSDKNCLLINVVAVEFRKITDFKHDGEYCWLAFSDYHKVFLHGPIGSGYHGTMANLKKILKQYVLYTKKGKTK